MENQICSLDSVSDSLERYTELLSEVPNHVPLMAPKNKKQQLFRKQILEAILYQEWIQSCSSIADIGTGSGFPGITLSLLNPDKQFYLIDRRQNCIAFLKKVINRLQLTNVQILCLQAEQLVTQTLKVQAVTARAVSRIKNLLSWSSPILEKPGLVILGKGKHCQDEIHQAESGDYSLIKNILQPFGSLLVYRKN